MFNEIATSRRFRGWKFGANIGFWPRESFALNFRCGGRSGLFESSGDNNAYTANDKTQHCKYCGNPSKQLTSHLAAGTCYIQRSKCQQQGYERHGEQHSNVAGANVLSTIRMLYTSAAMASLERLPEAPVNRGLFKIFQALFSFFGAFAASAGAAVGRASAGSRTDRNSAVRVPPSSPVTSSLMAVPSAP